MVSVTNPGSTGPQTAAPGALVPLQWSPDRQSAYAQGSPLTLPGAPITHATAQNALSWRNRTILAGDSLISTNYVSGGRLIPTTPGSLVVANGMATATAVSAHNMVPGQYFHIYNVGDPTWMADPFNGTNPLIISVPSSTTLTFATTAPNGDYSFAYGQQWGMGNPQSCNDTGLFQWLRHYLKHPWKVVANYSVNTRITQDMINLMPKMLSGPAFDEVILAVGINDIVTAATNTTAAQAGAVTAYQNFTGVGLANPALGILPQFMNYGARVVVIGPPAMDAAYTGVQYRTIAAANLRFLLKDWCARYPQQIKYVDLFAEMINGTLTTGGVLTNYTASGDLHPQTIGAINIAQNLVPQFANWFPGYDRTTTTLVEDQTTYSQPGALAPNIIPHGGMDGTTGTLGSGGVTGSLATGWTGQGSTGTVVGTGGNAKTAVAGTNFANWGLCQDIVFSGTAPSWIIQSPNFVANLVGGTWYEYGFTVLPVGTQTGLQQISAAFVGGGGNWPGNNTINQYQSTYNNGLPTPAGVPIEVISDPVFWPTGSTATIAALNLTAVYTGAATGHLQISNVWMRQIDNPYQ